MVIAFIVLMVMLGTPWLLARRFCVSGGRGGGCARYALLVRRGDELHSLHPGPDAWLAVGIDYSLFILNRYRTNLLDGMPKIQAIALANGTSGNAVIFAAKHRDYCAHER